MKKTNYTVTVYYLESGEGAELNVTGNAAEAVVAQAHAGQDLRFTRDVDGTPTDTIIEWSAVQSVHITKTIEDVPAPKDDICE